MDKFDLPNFLAQKTMEQVKIAGGRLLLLQQQQPCLRRRHLALITVFAALLLFYGLAVLLLRGLRSPPPAASGGGGVEVPQMTPAQVRNFALIRFTMLPNSSQLKIKYRKFKKSFVKIKNP